MVLTSQLGASRPAVVALSLCPCRQHEVTISAFLAPQILLMSVPVVGPIVFVPIQGAAAWLVDLFTRHSPTQAQSMQPRSSNEMHPSRMGQANYNAPTMPASPAVFTDPSGYGQSASSSGYGQPTTASGYGQQGYASKYG